MRNPTFTSVSSAKNLSQLLSHSISHDGSWQHTNEIVKYNLKCDLIANAKTFKQMHVSHVTFTTLEQFLAIDRNGDSYTINNYNGIDVNVPIQ